MDMSWYRRWIGGNWPEVQKWQYDFINDELLAYQPSKTFLDIGCGSLRLGSRLIKTHDAGKYIGLDTTQELINYGLDYEINPVVLEQKNPRFIVNDEFDLSSLGDEKIDIAWAYSTWIHVNDTKMKQGLRNVKNALSENGALFSSFGTEPPGPHTEKPDDDYVYDHRQLVYWRWEEDLARIFNECGLTFEYRKHTIKGGVLYRSVPLDRG